MRLELTGRHVDISPVLRRFVERKLAKLERLLDHRALSAQVVLTRGKRLLRADVTLHARGERFLHGVGEASAWEAALLKATEKIEQQAQKVKGKWQERKRQSRSGQETEQVTSERPPSRESAQRAPLRMPRILRTIRQVVRTLSVAEASDALDGSLESLLVFRDVETDRVNVLYRSAAGELVLVDAHI
jgi:putative sigma-54 modulation protein